MRSRIHDDIQTLHSTMPLWGVDSSVSLGDLFVDVNILEELSNSSRSELDDLWQDFSKNPSYRSLDRIGIGREQQRVSGLAVLAKNTNLMVVGKPGSGKTTYLQRIVTECNAGNLQAHRIPALIKLREFVNYGHEFAYSLERYFEQFWQLSNIEIKLIFHQGRALVLLDGLDEVTGEDAKNITKQIKQFARSYPQVRVIVTCRTQSFTGEMDWKSLRFSFVEVADFNETQVRSFSEHWFKAVIGDDSAGLAQSQEFLDQLFLDTNKPIRDLVITPILLSLTCLVFHKKGQFYSKRSKLYEEGLELLLEQWDKEWEIERDEIYRDLSPERKLELLSYLAVTKFEQPQYVLFEQSEIEGYIAEFLEIELRNSRAVLKAIESQHGLLIERANQVWSFSHLTFQEYFVAKWFCNYSNWQRLSQNIFESHYREVFLLTTEISPNLNQLMKSMKHEIDYKLRDDICIQNFLNRVYEKSASVNVSFHPRIIRAFYFEINRNNILDFQGNIQSSISHNVDMNINLLLHSEDASECILDYQLALLLYNAYYIAANPPYLNVFSYFHSNQEFIKVYEMLISYPLEDNLRRGLEKINSLLPEFSWENSKKFIDWTLKEGKIWADELRELIVKYRNIRHDMHWLSENNWRLLDQYYNATKLLLDCVNSSRKVSDEIKDEIEDTLLLPIAEIEKRKREIAE